MAYDRTAMTKSSCESCHWHTTKETLKHNGRILRVCRPCARVIKESKRNTSLPTSRSLHA